MKTLIIAEAGVNHNGSLCRAKDLIDAAADAGADFVKFQTFKSDCIASVGAHAAEYQRKNTCRDESQLEMLKQLELSPEMHVELIDYCKNRKIRFLSSAFDIESIDYLREIGLDLFKIPSGEITNLPYLRHVGRCAKSVIMSTGMASLGEVEAAINVLETAGMARDRILLLHCNTEYPTPMLDVNLKAMLALQNAFHVDVGYSDHTRGIEIPIAAVALGARVIEKHFTMSRDLPGPDHKASLEPCELKAMVCAIRNVEIALGDGIKRVSASEKKNISVVRKSLVAACPIQKGEVFSEANVAVKRPGAGLSPMLLDEVLGREASRSFERDELLEL